MLRRTVRRLFWFGLGLGFGVAMAFLASRWLKDVVQRWTPPAVADRAASSMRAWGDVLRQAYEEAKIAARVREEEIRLEMSEARGGRPGNVRALRRGIR